MLRSLSEILLPESSEKPAAAMMMPNPPVWIRARMTIWPKTDQWVAVSRTTRPVTHVAEVAVKRAVPNEVTTPVREEMGSIKSTVPRAIRPANPRMTILEEDGLIRFASPDNVACSFSCVAQLESIAERLVPDVS
jgi:hypothetical protein